MLGAVVVLLAGLVALTRSPLLAVRHIRVEGATRTTADAVVAASGLRTGQPILEVPSGSARRAVEQLPWIASASVRRSLPNTVVVDVTERVPAAVIPDGSESWLEVDTTGRVLARVGTRPSGLVAVGDLQPGAPPGRQVDAPAGVLALAAAVPLPLRPSVVSVQSGPDGLQLNLVGGGVARIGDAAGLAAKLVSVQAVLTSQGVTPNCVGVLDVTVAGAPALTSRTGCA